MNLKKNYNNYMFLFELLFLAGLTNFIVWANAPIQSLKKSLGLTYIPPRDANKPYLIKNLKVLLNCPICSGFWIGIIGHISIYLINPYLVSNYIILDVFMFGFAISMISALFDKILNFSCKG